MQETQGVNGSKADVKKSKRGNATKLSSKLLSKAQTPLPEINDHTSDTNQSDDDLSIQRVADDKEGRADAAANSSVVNRPNEGLETDQARI